MAVELQFCWFAWPEFVERPDEIHWPPPEEGFTTSQTLVNKHVRSYSEDIVFEFCQSSFKYIIIYTDYTYYTISGFTISVGEFERTLSVCQTPGASAALSAGC